MNCEKCHGSFEKEGRDPLLLPSCGHTLCKNCLRLFIQHNGFKCPFCGKKQPSNLKIEDLLPNYALLQMMESMNDENGRNGRKKDRHRSRGRAAEGKERSRERSVIKGTETECVEHEGVRLMYWCGPCGVAACGECVVEKHTGGGGGEGRRHQTVRIDAALKMRRSELQEHVIMLMNTLESAEKKHRNLTKSSPFITAAKKLQTEVTAVMGKIRVVLSLLARLIQEGEEGDAGLQHLRGELDELIQKTPPSGSTTGNVAEIMALLKHLKRIEEFRDGPVAKLLKEVEASSREDWMIFLSIASANNAVLNNKAIVLCKQLALCGGGYRLDVVGGGGLLGSLTWEQQKFHLHCLRLPSGPRRSNSDLARCHALKWQVLETQMEEVKQVFLDLVWGGPGQVRQGKKGSTSNSAGLTPPLRHPAAASSIK
ncbi:tripartite motif-containing protein 3-like [Portunus trituberculatus]|uniref:tripartite motif-containing protein 3-like n=1 Tax=Portunus trituberculatus TaxID=210409 RepID=UPI001E1D00CE|nr:tripartite motif-containing protein 3-like [Portunus trituberculatus]